MASEGRANGERMASEVPYEDNEFRYYGVYSKAKDLSRLNKTKDYLEKALKFVNEIEDTVVTFDGTIDSDYDALFDAEVKTGVLYTVLDKARTEIDFVYDSLYTARRGYDFNKYYKDFNKKKENDNYGNE